MIKTAKQLAEEHWSWLEQVLATQRSMEKKLYIDAFIHGCKHGEQRLHDGPKIICLCGSTRFKEAFMIEYSRLSHAGNIVLTVSELIPQHDGLTPEQEHIVHELHFRKIDIADEIFVLNVGRYIGEQCKKEIDYAQASGKTIKYLEEVNQ